jgi:hypothetical protein
MSFPSLFAFGHCPVCADSGIVIGLACLDSGELVFYCPLCGLAWRSPPGHRVDELTALSDLAPLGVRLPTKEEVNASGYPASEILDEQWYALLESELQRAGIRFQSAGPKVSV